MPIRAQPPLEPLSLALIGLGLGATIAIGRIGRDGDEDEGLGVAAS